MSVMYARHLCTIQLFIHLSIYPFVCLFVSSVYSNDCPSVRSPISIHKSDICYAATAAAAASTNSCAHSVSVGSALDNTLTQIRMYAFAYYSFCPWRTRVKSNSTTVNTLTYIHRKTHKYTNKKDQIEMKTKTIPITCCWALWFLLGRQLVFSSQPTNQQTLPMKQHPC